MIGNCETTQFCFKKKKKSHFLTVFAELGSRKLRAIYRRRINELKSVVTDKKNTFSNSFFEQNKKFLILRSAFHMCQDANYNQIYS